MIGIKFLKQFLDLGKPLRIVVSAAFRFIGKIPCQYSGVAAHLWNRLFQLLALRIRHTAGTGVMCKNFPCMFSGKFLKRKDHCLQPMLFICAAELRKRSKIRKTDIVGKMGIESFFHLVSVFGKKDQPADR